MIEDPRCEGTGKATVRLEEEKVGVLERWQGQARGHEAGWGGVPTVLADALEWVGWRLTAGLFGPCHFGLL